MKFSKTTYRWMLLCSLAFTYVLRNVFVALLTADSPSGDSSTDYLDLFIAMSATKTTTTTTTATLTNSNQKSIHHSFTDDNSSIGFDRRRDIEKEDDEQEASSDDGVHDKDGTGEDDNINSEVVSDDNSSQEGDEVEDNNNDNDNNSNQHRRGEKRKRRKRRQPNRRRGRKRHAPSREERLEEETTTSRRRSRISTVKARTAAQSRIIDQLVPEEEMRGPNCYANMKVPSFIIAGAQKAGTSALYYLLEQMHDLLPSLAFEAHFFDARGKLGRDAAMLSPEDVCVARREYMSFFDIPNLGPGMLSFEKTPVYLARPFVPALMKKVTPWVKVVVMLRNPVDRAYSAYKMNWERVRNESSLLTMEEMVDEQVHYMREQGLSTAPLFRNYVAGRIRSSDSFTIPPGLSTAERNDASMMDKLVPRGLYAQQLRNWLEHFTLDVDLKVIQYEKFDENRSAVLDEILNFVGVNHKHELPDSVLNEQYNPKRNAQRRVAKPFSPELRAYLHRFYKPYNDELADLLGEEWRDVWIEG